jgi:hypothetical protein
MGILVISHLALVCVLSLSGTERVHAFESIGTPSQSCHAQRLVGYLLSKRKKRFGWIICFEKKI